ncbi:tetratricopeptide repeat protein, partial [Dolichospermum sp. UHCC 0352]|uniref:tetratricopeptide repeat protein n=1 Tax=Dolichospermum sp. UHCC 0352 TaxID=2590011 RepID=UPI0020C320DB
MNTLTNKSIINANEQTYISLLVSIEAGIGMLQIFIAVCDADRQRENIIANYEKELAYTDNIYRVYLDSQEPSLKQAITQQVTLKENAIATVLGAEKLGSFNQDELLKKFFGYLQWTREALRELKMPIILWIPSRIYAQIAKQAPDFWSWRNGVFHFQPEPSLVTGELLINRNSEVILDNQASSIFSPEQLETSLAEAINQWGENSSKLETLYSQLGNLYAERVQSGKSADRERELALAQKYLNQAISLPSQLQVNPFTPPQPREGGLFGREEKLKELHELLQSGKNVCVVFGMSGVGKTALVREYANLPEYTSFFTGGVYYINVEDKQNMAAKIITLTKWRFKADLPANLSTQQMVTACWQAWKGQTENVLLIFDDISSLNKDIKSYLPPKDLVSLRVLMTSRETPDKRIAEKLELQVLSEAAAVDLLAAIIGQERIDTEPEQAKLLCYELGYLPLALELVAYYLDDEDYQDLSLLAMRGKLQEKVKHPSLSPKRVRGGIKAKRGLQVAFDLSWEELGPEAKYLACVFGAFAASPVHWDFVIEIYKQLQGEALNHDDLKDRWLKSLRELHLVMTVEENIYNLNLLIHDYFSQHLKQHSNYSQIKQAFCHVFAIIASDIDQSTNLETFNLIEPHLKKMIAWCASNDHPDVARSLNGLALLYYSQGRYNDAEPLYLQSLDIRKRQLGNDHPDVARSLNGLALLYYSQGRYNDAEPLYLQSLDIRKRQLGNDHPDVARSLNGLALLYYSQGRYNDAEPLYLQSLDIRKRQLGNDHPDVARSLNGLALLY